MSISSREKSGGRFDNPPGFCAKRIRRAAILLILVGLIGCGPKYIETSVVPDIEGRSVDPVALIPFIAESRASDKVRSGMVGESATETLTDQLYGKLMDRGLTVTRSETPEAGRFDPETDPVSYVQYAQEVGKRLGAPAVLFGTLASFIEREGSPLGIRTAASVGFTLHLISTEDGLLLWKARYYETQKSLFEDVMAFPLFFKRKAKWLTAAELSADAMNQLLATSPWAGAGTKNP